MKKLLLSLASVALMMSACTQDVAESKGNFAPADGKVSVAATFSSETRTAMTENSANGLDITWVAGDAIGLFGQDATATVGDNVEYTAVAAGKYSDFAYAGSSNAIAWGEGDHTFYAYYPYTAEEKRKYHLDDHIDYDEEDDDEYLDEDSDYCEEKYEFADFD